MTWGNRQHMKCFLKRAAKGFKYVILSMKRTRILGGTFTFVVPLVFLNKEITKTACWRRGFPHIHVVGTVDWPSAATPDHWITTLARRSQPRSEPGQKQVKLDPIQSYQPEVYHTQLLKEKGVGGCSLCCCIVLIIVSRVLSKLVHIIDNTFCLLRRVQFFHSNRRIWEPVFIAPQLYPWKGSWDGNKPADTQLCQWWHSTSSQRHWNIEASEQKVFCSSIFVFYLTFAWSSKTF